MLRCKVNAPRNLKQNKQILKRIST
jgi:hypothetical protein